MQRKESDDAFIHSYIRTQFRTDEIAKKPRSTKDGDFTARFGGATSPPRFIEALFRQRRGVKGRGAARESPHNGATAESRGRRKHHENQASVYVNETLLSTLSLGATTTTIVAAADSPAALYEELASTFMYDMRHGDMTLLGHYFMDDRHSTKEQYIKI